MTKSYKIGISTLFMWLLMLLQVKFCWLIPVKSFYSINSNQQQILMVVVLLIAFLFLKGRPFNYGTKSSRAYLGVFFLYYIVELLISTIKNGQGIVNAFVASNFYLMLLLYFFTGYFVKRKGLDEFYHIVIWVSMANIIVCWLQYILAKFGVYFTQIDTSSMRFGNIRIGAISETITSLGLFLCFSYFLNENEKRKWKYFAGFVLGVLGHLIVSKGRMSLLALFAGCCIYVLDKYKRYAKKILAVICSIIIVCVAFLSSPIGKVYLNSLSDAETDTGSIRTREIAYYNEQTKESPIFGVGFIRDIGDQASNKMKGPVHQYSRTDVGIWGLANAMGYIGVAWYLLLTVNLLKKLYYISKHKKDDNYYIVVAYMAFSIVYIPTMIFMNPFSITSQAVLMTLIDYNYMDARIKR